MNMHSKYRNCGIVGALLVAMLTTTTAFAQEAPVPPSDEAPVPPSDSALIEPPEVIFYEAAGDVKPRHIRRINDSLKKALIGQENTQWLDWPKGDTAKDPFLCASNPACLGEEGALARVDYAIGISVTKVKEGLVLKVIVLQVSSQDVVGSKDLVIPERKVRKEAGPQIVDYWRSDEIQKVVTAPPAPPEPESVPEPAAAPEPEPEPEPEPAPEPEPQSEVEVAAPVAVAPATAAPRFQVGLQTGVFLPQVASELGTSFAAKLDAGGRVWKNLSVVGAVAYAQPKVSSTMDDPRFPSGTYSTSTTQRELALSLVAVWRLFPPGARFNGYGGAGWKMWMLKTLTNGDSADESFLENTETSTKQGGTALLGGEFALGPGSLSGELEFGGSDLGHFITGDVTTMGINIAVGYRMHL
jgi:hypothetical protein